MKLDFKASFVKDLKRIRNKSIYRRVRGLIQEVELAANTLEIKDIKKLKAEGKYYRIRIGDYRVGLIITDDLVIFVRCLHRNEIYRYFP